MATLTRPGVEVVQEITPAAPTILTPSLNPCLVGPCFAIASPLTATGELDTATEVSIPAIVNSLAALGEEVAAASQVLAISVDVNSMVIMELPAVASGSNIELAAIPESIMAKVPGLSVSLNDTGNGLIFKTKTTGANSKIKFHTKADLVAEGLLAASKTMAYQALGLEIVSGATVVSTAIDIDHFGQGPYTNMTYASPYAMLPTLAHHPAGDQLVFEGDNCDLYRFFMGKLSVLSKDSAINHTSMRPGGTSLAGQALMFGAPHTFYLAPLMAKKGVGSTTNRVMDIGKNASVVIPMPHGIGNQATATGHWPDASLKNSITAEALGTQAYALDQSAAVGVHAGEAGNDLTIAFANSTTGTGNTVTGIAFNNGTKTLTIDLEEGCTYATLKTAIDGSTAISDNFGVFTLQFDDGAALCNGDAGVGEPGEASNGIMAGKSFPLGGGHNPKDFTSDEAAHNFARIIGSPVIDDALCADLAGKKISLAVNGEPSVDIVIPSTQAGLLAAINDDPSLKGKVTASAGSVGSEYSGSAHTVLVLKAEPVAGTTEGHDCTLELGGDAEAIEGLFTGYISKTETVTAGSAGAAIDVDLAQGGGANEYNKHADTDLQQAVVPGSISLKVGDVGLAAHAVSNSGGTSAINLAANTYHITLSHDGFIPDSGGNAQSGVAGDEFTINWTMPNPATPSATDVAALIQTALNGISAHANQANLGNGLAGLANAGAALKCVALELNDSTSDKHVVFVDATNQLAGGTQTQKFRIISFANASNLPGGVVEAQHTEFTNAYAGNTDQNSVLNVDLKSALGTITFSDNPDNTALPMTATPSVSYPAPAGWSILSGTVADISTVQYATGAIRIRVDNDLAHPASSYTRQLTYSRGAASAISLETNPNDLDYTSFIWTGASSKVASGDRLWDSGSVVASVVKIEDLAVSGGPGGSWGAGAILVLSAEAVDNGSELSNWYITAENLPSSGGRAQPEIVWNDVSQEVTIKHALNRGTNGMPVTGAARIFTEFKALRLDVSDAATTPGLLVFNSATEVESQIGPISTANPLAFGLYLGFLNSPTSSLSALGISQTTANAPDGTVKSYLNALTYLKQHEVYALAPLTHDTGVHQLINGHVTALSAPAQKKERIGLVCPKLPKEKPPKLVHSATGVTVEKQSTGIWQFDFGATTNLVSVLNGKTDANGNTISAGVGSVFTAKQGVYLTREGDPFKYLIDKLVSASVVQVRTNFAFDDGMGPGTAGNDDAYYLNDPVSGEDEFLAEFPASGETCVVSIRNVAIDTATTAGKLVQCETMAEIAGGPSGYQNRRLVFMQPQTVATTYGGLEILVPGYYLCGAVAAMIGQFNPSQPFTNLPMVGFTRPIGSSDRFNEDQMATAAAGGVYWVIQDATGAPLVSRHQLTTDLTSVKTRELSVTKALDYVAKQLRIAVRRFIGRNNITQGLLSQIALTITGNLKSLIGSAVADADLKTLYVADDAPDEIAVEVEVTPFYPANKITIRIIV